MRCTYQNPDRKRGKYLKVANAAKLMLVPDIESNHHNQSLDKQTCYDTTVKLNQTLQLSYLAFCWIVNPWLTGPLLVSLFL